jgi:proteic killer suppression protein
MIKNGFNQTTRPGVITQPPGPAILLTRVAQQDTLCGMIKSFKHKGLKQFFESGSLAGVQANHAKKLTMQLAAIDTAQEIDDINLPGFALHPLNGERDGIWSISVNGNWRITFEFQDGNAYILNYEDYH